MTFRMAIALAGSMILNLPNAASATEGKFMEAKLEQENREFVRGAFERWSRGEGDIFSLLADDATWRIVGNDPEIAKTYHSREALMAAAARPLAERLRGPLKPSVEKIWADGDDVVVHWNGSGPLINDTTYRNSYLWILTLKDQRIVAVTAFLDIPTFKAALALPVAND